MFYFRSAKFQHGGRGVTKLSLTRGWLEPSDQAEVERQQTGLDQTTGMPMSADSSQSGAVSYRAQLRNPQWISLRSTVK
jgi:hypothetical protein